MQKSYFLIAALLTSVLATAHSSEQISSNDTQADAIETIVIIANRQPRKISQVASSVTVINQETIRQNIALSIEDIVRYQPGIDVDNNSTRFGSNGFRIRGIGGNRTLTVIDNIPVSDNFSVGNFSNSGRGLIELNLVNNVEVLRGPASTLYGSKALGGVVAIKLLDADDLLDYSDINHRLNLAYNSDHKRFATTVGSAFSTQNTKTLIAAAYQQGHEAEPAYMPATSSVDSQDNDNRAILFRSTYLSDYGQFRLTLNSQLENRETDIRAILGVGRLRNTTKLEADDELRQERFVLDHNFEKLGFLDRGSWRLWHQKTQTDQYTYEERLAAPEPISLWRDFNFLHKSTGLAADFESYITLNNIQHRIGYGFELINNKVSDLRNAEQTDIQTSQTTKTLLGETFPLRDFPNSNVNEYGVYLHDEISLFNDELIISPGIRFEHYALKPQADPLFDERYPNARKTELITNYWLPKLGLLYALTDRFQWFAQYAKGYRSPPFSDVNIGLFYPQFNIIAISNPKLKSEKGNTFETGIRWHNKDTQLEVSVFHNRYKDFIQTRAPLGFDPVLGSLVFQSINRDKVVIEGVEIQANHFWTNNFSTNLNLAWISGKDDKTNQHLASITPPSAIIEFMYYSESSYWQTRLLGTFSKAQKEIFDNEEALFSAPGYARWDILTQFFVNDSMDINIGIYNITDKNYWQNSSVLAYTQNEPTIPLLAEAGLSFAISLNYSF